MALPVDLDGLRIEAARLVNEDVNPAGCLEQPLRGAGVAAVDEARAIPLHHASHGAAVTGLVIGFSLGLPKYSVPLSGEPSLSK